MPSVRVYGRPMWLGPCITLYSYPLGLALINTVIWYHARFPPSPVSRRRLPPSHRCTSPRRARPHGRRAAAALPLPLHLPSPLFLGAGRFLWRASRRRCPWPRCSRRGGLRGRRRGRSCRCVCSPRRGRSHRCVYSPRRGRPPPPPPPPFQLSPLHPCGRAGTGSRDVGAISRLPCARPGVGAAGGALPAAGTASALAAVADAIPAGVAGLDDPPPPIPPSLDVDQSLPPPVAPQGYTIAALTTARAEHAARQARLREAALVWERDREAADAIAAQIAAAEQLLACGPRQRGHLLCHHGQRVRRPDHTDRRNRAPHHPHDALA
jgi:hypothetical protein